MAEYSDDSHEEDLAPVGPEDFGLHEMEPDKLHEVLWDTSDYLSIHRPEDHTHLLAEAYLAAGILELERRTALKEEGPLSFAELLEVPKVQETEWEYRSEVVQAAVREGRQAGSTPAEEELRRLHAAFEDAAYFLVNSRKWPGKIPGEPGIED